MGNTVRGRLMKRGTGTSEVLRDVPVPFFRLKKIRKTMSDRGMNGLLITKVANVTYATGFLGDDSWALITPKNAYLLTDSRYTEQALKECPACKVIERKEGLAKTAAQYALKRGTGTNVPSVEKKGTGTSEVLRDVPVPFSTVGVEDSTTAAELAVIRKEFRGTKIVLSKELIESIRAIKDEAEILILKKAAKIAQDAMAETLGLLDTGMTEAEAAGLLNFNIRKRGWRESFETIVAFGPNASRPHHLSGPRKLRSNDTILIDWGVKYAGYCCDLTRCFAIGRVSQFYKKVYDAVRRAQLAAIAKVRAGVDIREVDEAARAVLRESRLPVFGHGTGHGIGLEVHEKPIVSPRGKGTLRAGEVITIEPGVYIPGKLGVRIEDDVLVTPTGHKLLSRQANELQIL
jgi:Xaa-Pro aminopeptidase